MRLSREPKTNTFKGFALPTRLAIVDSQPNVAPLVSMRPAPGTPPDARAHWLHLVAPGTELGQRGGGRGATRAPSTWLGGIRRRARPRHSRWRHAKRHHFRSLPSSGAHFSLGHFSLAARLAGWAGWLASGTSGHTLVARQASRKPEQHEPATRSRSIVARPS